MPDFLVTNDIFKSETEILKGICADESCVIAGRSGFYVLRDHPNHLSILIQAKMEYRVKRLMGRRGISEEEAVKIIKEGTSYFVAINSGETGPESLKDVNVRRALALAIDKDSISQVLGAQYYPALNGYIPHGAPGETAD